MIYRWGCAIWHQMIGAARILACRRSILGQSTIWHPLIARPRAKGFDSSLPPGCDYNQTMQGRRAFTLVELLAAIGIIALLLGILLPVISRARAQSRSVACGAQLHSIGQAFRIYLNENRDNYPHAPTLPSVNPDHLPPLADYLDKALQGQRGVFRCPADESLYPVEGTSYFYYAEVGERKIAETFFFSIFKNVNQVPILWDAANFHGGTVPFNWLFADGSVDHLLAEPGQLP